MSMEMKNDDSPSIQSMVGTEAISTPFAPLYANPSRFQFHPVEIIVSMAGRRVFPMSANRTGGPDCETSQYPAPVFLTFNPIFHSSPLRVNSLFGKMMHPFDVGQSPTNLDVSTLSKINDELPEPLSQADNVATKGLA